MDRYSRLGGTEVYCRVKILSHRRQGESAICTKRGWQMEQYLILGTSPAPELTECCDLFSSQNLTAFHDGLPSTRFFLQNCALVKLHKQHQSCFAQTFLNCAFQFGKRARFVS